jgi:hypothetical protein
MVFKLHSYGLIRSANYANIPDNIQIVNEGRIIAADVLIKNGRIERVEPIIL